VPTLLLHARPRGPVGAPAPLHAAPSTPPPEIHGRRPSSSMAAAAAAPEHRSSSIAPPQLQIRLPFGSLCCSTPPGALLLHVAQARPGPLRRARSSIRRPQSSIHQGRALPHAAGATARAARRSSGRSRELPRECEGEKDDPLTGGSHLLDQSRGSQVGVIAGFEHRIMTAKG
jgi:hypothetical protein